MYTQFRMLSVFEQVFELDPDLQETLPGEIVSELYENYIENPRFLYRWGYGSSTIARYSKLERRNYEYRRTSKS